MSSKSQTARENEEFVREMSNAIWGADGSPDAVEEYMAEDFVSHEPGQTIEGREAYREFEAELRSAMPDLEGSLDFIVAEDDKVVARYTATGTHLGELWGIEPTRATGEVTGTTIYRIEDGKATECWHEYDRLGMMQQLGVIPENPTA